MRCPYCATLDNRVMDWRLSQGGEVTRLIGTHFVGTVGRPYVAINVKQRSRNAIHIGHTSIGRWRTVHQVIITQQRGGQVHRHQNHTHKVRVGAPRQGRNAHVKRFIDHRVHANQVGRIRDGAVAGLQQRVGWL